MINFVFTVSFFLPTYGGAAARVIAPNAVEAVRLAAGTEQGWMLLDPMVEGLRVDREFTAMCSHGRGTYNRPDVNVWECDDCLDTFHDGDYATPTATREGFRAYCQGLIDSGAAFR